MKSANEFAEYLDKLIEKAPLLRKAGVLGFDLKDFGKVDLYPTAADLSAQPLPPSGTADGEEIDEDDPRNYGLEPGTKLPWNDDEGADTE